MCACLRACCSLSLSLTHTLCTLISMFILLSGMVFQSSYLAVNSVPYNILTYLVSVPHC